MNVDALHSSLPYLTELLLFPPVIDDAYSPLYSACMARKLSTTVRLDVEDAEALARARADGLSASDLIRQGLRIVAAKYYRGRRRPPSTRLFISTSAKLGEESELFKDLGD